MQMAAQAAQAKAKETEAKSEDIPDMNLDDENKE